MCGLELRLELAFGGAVGLVGVSVRILNGSHAFPVATRVGLRVSIGIRMKVSDGV